MIVSRRFDWGCMRFGAIKCRNREQRIAKTQLPGARKLNHEERERTSSCTKRKLAELLFENCAGCKRMAAIPQGAYAVCKVRRNRERTGMITMMEGKENGGSENVSNARSTLEAREPTPLKYNSKLMNSIWGLYNRYSVHNFKKNTDADEGVFQSFVADWEVVLTNHVPAANTVIATAIAENN